MATEFIAAAKEDPDYEVVEEGDDGARVFRRHRSTTGPYDLAWRRRWERDRGWTLCFETEVGGASVEVRVQPMGDESVTPTEVKIFAPPGESLSQEAIRHFSLGKLLHQAEKETWRPFLGLALGRQGSSWGDFFVDRPRPGRAGRPDIEYAVWAQRYVEAVAADSRSPVKQLAAAHPGFSESAIRAILNKARSRGLLTAAPPGRPGGDLTIKAKQLLQAGGGS